MEPTSTTQTLQVEPTTLAIGAIVGGLDLRAELGEESRRELRRALAEREVLFLPSQQIDPEDNLRFAAIFGEPQQVGAFSPSRGEHPIRGGLLEGNGESMRTDVRHSDVTWPARPAVATASMRRASGRSPATRRGRA